NAPHCFFSITTSDGTGAISGTNSDQSGGIVAGRLNEVSLCTFSIVSGDATTCTRNTGMLFFRNACTSFAAFFTTSCAVCGCVGMAAIPFCRSMTTRAVVVLVNSNSGIWYHLCEDGGAGGIYVLRERSLQWRPGIFRPHPSAVKR